MLELSLERPLELATSDARHGYGCFETVRIQGGEPRWLAPHLARLAAGCRFLGLDAPPEPEAVAVFLHGKLPEQGVLNLTALDGGLGVRIGPAPPALQQPVRVEIAQSLRRFSQSPLNRHKTLSYLENRLLHREAAARGCFDVIALNEHGCLTDGGRTNVFLDVEGGIWTPPVEDGALPGIARQLLLASGLVQERSLSVADFECASALWVANALRGVLQVRGTPLPQMHEVLA